MFNIKPPLSVNQCEIELPGKRYLGNVPTSSDMKFGELMSTNVGHIRENTIFYMNPPFCLKIFLSETTSPPPPPRPPKKKKKENRYSSLNNSGEQIKAIMALFFLPCLSTKCSRGAFRVVQCSSSVGCRPSCKHLFLDRWANLDQT